LRRFKTDYMTIFLYKPGWHKQTILYLQAWRLNISAGEDSTLGRWTALYYLTFQMWPGESSHLRLDWPFILSAIRTKFITNKTIGRSIFLSFLVYRRQDRIARCRLRVTGRVVYSPWRLKLHRHSPGPLNRNLKPCFSGFVV
jgi:hypothetical protein